MICQSSGIRDEGCILKRPSRLENDYQCFGKIVVHRTNDRSMYRNVLFLNYAQTAINTNVSETSKLGDISVFFSGCHKNIQIKWQLFC